MAKKRRGGYKKCGLSTQLAICACNGIVWVTSMILISFGLAIGFYTRTISIWDDFSPFDWIIPTPATIFLFYGLVLFVVGISGCFASVSGNMFCIFFYVVFICGAFAYDVLFGLSFACPLDVRKFPRKVTGNSYNHFMEKMKESQMGYGVKSAKLMGMVPILPPKKYWDHYQHKGKCCGLESLLEWKRTPIAKEHKSIPDGCCGTFFKDCGAAYWGDAEVEDDDDGEWEQLTLNVNTSVNGQGCLSIFPPILRKDQYGIVNITGIAIMAILLLCLLLALVLIFLVCCKAFRPSQGLTNPEFAHIPENPKLNQVAPGGDDEDYENNNGERRVSFDDGPSYMDGY